MIVLCVAFSGKMPLIFNATFASRLTQISTIQSRLESNSFQFFFMISTMRATGSDAPVDYLMTLIPKTT